ncbi:MAG: HPr kinase/phosphorylase [Candidatus Dactylopiibacterium carminicum]|uniref:HPr kinase/phosphorylase n=1 Tax=Candidatus Dactylopiibacterium carminicum TaxID=857335 RepID=A0A272EYY6_9RHOO|nr:HPr(Ser) kinase/phosphatase [Candidatus Dactylopiibacterium carminicum]KAF7600822.1 HPr kinase/phosphorylase [Candidatus Dactylopiibacterium carminicum]PAS95321.1 MAG: HPr kinase/phosphorylase [Candidatus Dactylopiibacterium carminicum]PAS98667.1 MAG: HPr kinase/phosphorylase [Candidatus Dactylopiibacterium carminicum]PAT00828.1 MAG: HPr kinase/phosphorylase [Candidatus Dactylopiibacterium carminicum]
MRRASVAQLFEANRGALQLRHVAGRLDTFLSAADSKVWPADMVGHLNMIHPSRLQIMGEAEFAWARQQTRERLDMYMLGMITSPPPGIIVADDCEVPEIVRRACDEAGVPVMASPLESARVIEVLRGYLSRKMAERVSLHGVFMDVLGVGVLITGDSGAGKSELALELISRGHGLVADDVVEISRVAANVLEGRCPEMLKDFLEVRGLGILNIRTIFGETACRRKMRLKLIAHLQRRSFAQDEPLRLPYDGEDAQDVLGVPVRRVVLPVAAGRNLSVLLEAAVRNTILQLRGIDSTQEFVVRQRALLDQDDPYES